LACLTAFWAELS